MRQEKHKSRKPATALILCFCLMALVSIFTVKASIDKIKSNMESANVVKKQAVEEVKETESTAPEVIDSIDNSSGAAESETIPEYIMPVEGDIIMEHCVDMPVYWQTLDQYMTHSGIDIACELETPVQVCDAGTVTKIDKESAMGITIEVNHGNGLISVYSNLSADGLIELGEVVTKGQVLGYVGQSSMFEFEDPDHLHFEIIKNGKAVNPADYLTL